MSIMAQYIATGPRFVLSKNLVFLGLFALLLGCEIRMATLNGIRWWTLVALVTMSWLVLVNLPLISCLTVGGIGCMLMGIYLTLRRSFLLWQRWRRHGRFDCLC